jgi:hypothetical protein
MEKSRKATQNGKADPQPTTHDPKGKIMKTEKNTPMTTHRPGKVFHALSQKDLRETRPIFAFVPESLLTKTTGPEGTVWHLNQEDYSLLGWDSINCGANDQAVGSHVFPDLNHPATADELAKPAVRAFLENVKNLRHKAEGKKRTHRAPGIAGMNPELR